MVGRAVLSPSRSRGRGFWRLAQHAELAAVYSAIIRDEPLRLASRRNLLETVLVMKPTEDPFRSHTVTASSLWWKSYLSALRRSSVCELRERYQRSDLLAVPLV